MTTTCDFAALELVLEALYQPGWIVATSGHILYRNAAARAATHEVSEAIRQANDDAFDDPRFAVSRVAVDTAVLLVVARNLSAGPPLPRSLARVATLAARGLADKDIANELAAPLATVRTYMRRIYARLGVRSRAELARRWLAIDTRPA